MLIKKYIYSLKLYQKSLLSQKYLKSSVSGIRKQINHKKVINRQPLRTLRKISMCPNTLKQRL